MDHYDIKKEKTFKYKYGNTRKNKKDKQDLYVYENLFVSNYFEQNKARNVLFVY